MVERSSRTDSLTELRMGRNSVVFNFGNSTYLYERLGNSIHSGTRQELESLASKVEEIDYVPEYETKSLERTLTGKVQVMTISVTEDCNIACKYCFFSDIYPESRLPSTKTMDVERAMNAIDLFTHVAGEDPILTFFGGEPTTNWGLIEKGVKKAREKRPDMRFLIVTNGLSLKRHAEKLIELDMMVNVSLDGPREVHDKYRKTHGEKPTHKIIWEGIRYLQELSPEYVKENVSLSATCWDAEDFAKIVEFNIALDGRFANHYIGFVEEKGMLEGELAKHQNGHDLMSDLIHYGLQHVETIASGKEPPDILKKIFDRPLKGIYRAPREVMPEKLPLAGSCPPGEISLFLDTDGDFRMCEKLINKDGTTVTTEGLEQSEQFNVLENVARVRNDTCTECWLSRLCLACEVTLQNEKGELTRDALVEWCLESKNSNLLYLALYARLLEIDKNKNHINYFESEMGRSLR